MRFLQSIILVSLFSFAFSKIAHADTIIPKQRRVSIQIAPLSLLDFYNGSCYKLGTEIRLSRSIYLSADFGGYFPNFNGLKNIKGFNADFRIKYQFPNSSSMISLNYFYKQQSFDYHDSYIQDPNTPIAVHVQKYVNCVNLNYERRIGQLFKDGYIDVFAGLGVRFRNVHSFETKHQFDELEKGGDSQTLYLVLIPGQDVWLNLNLGLRVGFYLF